MPNEAVGKFSGPLPGRAYKLRMDIRVGSYCHFGNARGRVPYRDALTGGSAIAKRHFAGQFSGGVVQAACQYDRKGTVKAEGKTGKSFE
jgi:hypothetical protein